VFAIAKMIFQNAQTQKKYQRTLLYQLIMITL